MAFPCDQEEEFFLNLRTSPTISIIIAAFKVYLNDVIATFYGFSGPFYITETFRGALKSDFGLTLTD